MRIFLGFAYRDADKDLAGWCDQLFASMFAHTVTGERLGGDQITPAVQARIDQCDALVGLLTRRDPKVDGSFTTHDWVRDEITYARTKGKRVIAVMESMVENSGMFQGNERIDLDRANPLPAFLRLAETVGEWRRAMGRTVKVQILPPKIARTVKSSQGAVQCSHRLWSRGVRRDWVPVHAVPEENGTFVWVDGVQDDDLIQIKIDGIGKKSIESPAISQWMQIQLEPGGGK